MSRDLRRAVFWLGAAGFAVLFLTAVVDLPHFGTDFHPYGDRAVQVALNQRQAANTVSSVNFDQRGFDTLGEETILLAAVLGVVVLLRPAADEHRTRARSLRVPASIRVFGLTMLPLVTLAGVYVVGHGQISPGGGFQGGVVLATALQVMYIAEDYGSLRRMRPVALFETADSVGAISFAMLGFAGIIAGGAYLANTLPLGRFNHLVSGGTLPLFNIAVGIEVGAGMIVIVARFLDQVLAIRQKEGA